MIVQVIHEAGYNVVTTLIPRGPHVGVKLF